MRIICCKYGTPTAEYRDLCDSFVDGLCDADGEQCNHTRYVRADVAMRLARYMYNLGNAHGQEYIADRCGTDQRCWVLLKDEEAQQKEVKKHSYADDGYWWCHQCEREVHAQQVTFEEVHTVCGHEVEWICNTCGTQPEQKDKGEA